MKEQSSHSEIKSSVKYRKEIGSEFWDVPTNSKMNKLFPESTQWFISGRSALQSIIKELDDARSVSLPSWCCDSMIKPFVDAGYTIHFYSVFFDKGLVQDIRTDSDVLFLMDYFGYTGSQIDTSGFEGIVIRDVTHSLFSSTYSDADFYFGSLRKWCGMWTAGYAWARDKHKLDSGNKDNHAYTSLRKNAMCQKAEYIYGARDDKDYLELFDRAEEKLDHFGIIPASNRDVMLARTLDVEKIRSRRRSNAAVLRAAFPEWLIFTDLSPSDTPMFVPIFVPDGKRNALRKYLIQNEIYCPIHWPVSEYHKLDKKTAYLYQNELSLVCDQRYTRDDMYRMVEVINTFMEG